MDPLKERDAMSRIWKKRGVQFTRVTTGKLSMVANQKRIRQGAVGQLAAPGFDEVEI